jgi:outer membrane protein TolC
MKKKVGIISPGILAIMLIAVVTANPLAAQDSMDLKQCLTLAMEHNTAVQKAAMDEDAAAYSVKEAFAEGLPQVTGQVDVNMFPSIATQILPGEIIGQPGTQVPVQFGTKYNATVGGRVTQMIYDQRFLTGLEAARRSRELYKLLHLQTEEQVIQEVATSYYRILELKAQQGGLDSQLVMMTELERIMEVQVANQYKRTLDLQRVKVNRQNTMTERDGIALAHDQQLNYLKVLMGIPVAEDLDLVQPKDLGIHRPTAVLDTLYRQRTDIKVIKEQIALQDLQVKVTRAGYMPTLSAFGSYNYQAQRNEFNFLEPDQNWFNTSQVGVTLAVPVFDGMRKHSRIGKQKVELLQQQADLAQAENTFEMEERNALAELQASWTNVEAQASNLVLADDVFQQSDALYKEGLSPLTDLLDAEQALQDTRTAYYRAALRFKLAELDLLRAQGGLKTLI